MSSSANSPPATTPDQSNSKTIARGSIAELVARDPVLATQLAGLRTDLQSAQVSEDPNDISTVLNNLPSPTVPDARTADQILVAADQILGRTGITRGDALEGLKDLAGSLNRRLRSEVEPALVDKFYEKFPKLGITPQHGGERAI